MIGEPDAGKPHVRFDEGVQETCDIAARLRPTLPGPRFKKAPFLWFCRASGCRLGADQALPLAARMRFPHSISNWFSACFQCWMASHFALAFRRAR